MSGPNRPFSLRTPPQVRAEIKNALGEGNATEAAAIMLENQDIIAPWWLDWAFKIRAGMAAPVLKDKQEIPVWKEGELFGEPLTTGRKFKKRR